MDRHHLRRNCRGSPSLVDGRLSIDQGVAGTAFLFGAGIYCGTYLLGTNFIYRLMFLLLCIPQLLNWLAPNSERTSWVPEAGMLALTLGVLC